VGLSELVGSGPVALDTAIFIYFVERHPEYVERVRPLFQKADSGDLELVTSALTLLEVLVVPYRVGDIPLAERYEAILTRGRGLRMVEIDRAQIRTAAQLRAMCGVRTPDALQLAAALSACCTAFVTNDRRLPTLPGLRIIQLDSHC
jgi:predicted nucleic acid-binding protein